MIAKILLFICAFALKNNARKFGRHRPTKVGGNGGKQKLFGGDGHGMQWTPEQKEAAMKEDAGNQQLLGGDKGMRWSPKQLAEALVNELVGDDDPCFGVFTNQPSCDNDPRCVWCNAGAVKPNCYSIEDAKQLPPGVFTCDTKPPSPSPGPGPTADCENDFKDEQTCDAQDGCTWCKSGAVPSKCYTEEDAKSLPPGVFICDGVTLGKRNIFGANGHGLRWNQKQRQQAQKKNLLGANGHGIQWTDKQKSAAMKSKKANFLGANGHGIQWTEQQKKAAMKAQKAKKPKIPSEKLFNVHPKRKQW